MKALREKLACKRGASILLSFLFFLVCTTTGALVLASATANAARVGQLQAHQQAYFTVRSAAQLLQDQLEDACFQVVETRIDDGPPTYQTIPAGGPLAPQLNSWAGAVALGGHLPLQAEGLTLTCELGEVQIAFSMDEGYGITLALHLEGAIPAPMTLTLEGLATQTHQQAITPILDAQGDLAGEQVTRTTTTTILWGQPAIIKEGP